MWSVLIVTTYLPISLGCILWWGWRGAEAEIWLQVCGYFPLRDTAIGVAIGAILVLATRVVTPWLAFSRRMEASLAEVVGPISMPTCLGLALASAVGEEFLFRGVIQSEIGQMWTAVLFAADHVPLERALLPWPLFAFVVGLILGGLYQWSGSLPAPIAVHFTLNFLNLLWLARVAAERGSSNPQGILPRAPLES